MLVVVTGAGGFVGRELVGRLLDAGHRVVATDTAPGAIPPGLWLLDHPTEVSARSLEIAVSRHRIEHRDSSHV